MVQEWTNYVDLTDQNSQTQFETLRYLESSLFLLGLIDTVGYQPGAVATKSKFVKLTYVIIPT